MSDFGQTGVSAEVVVAVLIALFLLIGMPLGALWRKKTIKKVDHRGVFISRGKTLTRDDEAYRRAMSRIPATDQVIGQLQSPLSAGAADQWRHAKQSIVPLPDHGGLAAKQVSAAMESAHRIERISAAAATLLAAEQGDEDARVAIVEDLYSDIRYATTPSTTDTLEGLHSRDALHALADRLRALKGRAASPAFFTEFTAIASDYASLTRSDRARQSEPAKWGDELFVFGTGVNGLVPLLQGQNAWN